MKTYKTSIKRLALLAGIIITLALIFYFLSMKFLGLAQNSELRFLNFIIVSVGIAITFKYYQSKNRTEIAYLPGIGLGFLTSGISSILFSIFVYVYFSWIDQSFLGTLKSAVVWSGNITPGIAATTVLIEGMGSAFVISFLLMQYFKTDLLKSIKKMHVVHTPNIH